MEDTMEIIYNETKPYKKKHWRTFEASSNLFSGFRVDINITKIDTLNDIKIYEKMLQKKQLSKYINI